MAGPNTRYQTRHLLTSVFCRLVSNSEVESLELGCSLWSVGEMKNSEQYGRSGAFGGSRRSGAFVGSLVAFVLE